MSRNLTKVATIVDIARLKEEGLSKQAVAKRLSISRGTVSKYWNTTNLELRQSCYSSRAQLVDPYICWSRVNYIEFVVRLDMASFLTSLHRALEYIGGVPREILFDNAKVVVSERVGNIVRFSEDLLQLALAYGFTPRACWKNSHT